MRHFRGNKRPKTAGQLKKQVENLETKLETEALKFSEEKKIRSQIKSIQKEIKNMLPTRSSFASKSKTSSSAPVELELKENLAEIFKEQRLKRQMNHEEFAAFISEKVSTYQKWENGTATPPIDIAKRVQKQLKTGLLKQASEGQDDDANKLLEQITKSSKKRVATLGDVIKIKTRNR